MVADRGYHSGAVLERVKSYAVRTYIPEKKQAGQRHWEGKTGRDRRCTRIDGGCAAATAKAYCGGAANWWNAALRTATRRAA